MVSNLFKYKNPVLWFGPPPRSNPNTQSISACDISKERKRISAQVYNLLFFSRGYTLRVVIELIYATLGFTLTQLSQLRVSIDIDEVTFVYVFE